MMVKSGLVLFFFEILLAPLELLLSNAKKKVSGKAELAGRLADNSEGASRISK